MASTPSAQGSNLSGVVGSFGLSVFFRFQLYRCSLHPTDVSAPRNLDRPIPRGRLGVASPRRRCIGFFHSSGCALAVGERRPCWPSTLFGEVFGVAQRGGTTLGSYGCFNPCGIWGSISSNALYPCSERYLSSGRCVRPHIGFR